MKFVVAYDEGTGIPIDFWPYDWLEANTEEWHEQTNADAFVDAVYMEQETPMFLAPAEINGKEVACMGLHFKGGWPLYAVYGDVLREHYFICDSSMEVVYKTNDFAKAVLKLKEFTNVSR